MAIVQNLADAIHRAGLTGPEADAGSRQLDNSPADPSDILDVVSAIRSLLNGCAANATGDDHAILRRYEKVAAEFGDIIRTLDDEMMIGGAHAPPLDPAS